MKEFGLYLRELRKKYKYSLQDLSEQLGVGVPFLSLIENGKKLVPADYADKLTKIMSLNDDEILELKNSIDYSNKKIQIDLENMTDEQKEVSIYFARSIQGASPEMIDELRKILEGKNK